MSEPRTVARPPQLSARSRAALAKRLTAIVPQLAAATIAEMAEHRWFATLDAPTSAQIHSLVSKGLDAFASWFADGNADPDGLLVFETVPRPLARRITLHQTVDLVRTTIAVVEARAPDLVPRGDRQTVQMGILTYSRELAFAAAEAYARAAETRGAWDARLEALVVDAVVRGEATDTVVSRASTLGWRATRTVSVVVGRASENEPDRLGEELRRRARHTGCDLLSAIQGNRLIVIIGVPDAADEAGGSEEAKPCIEAILDAFGPGPVVVGPLVEDLTEATRSVRSALSALRAADAWPEAPRPVSDAQLLPERALAGDQKARDTLAEDIYAPLDRAGGGLLETLVSFLDHGSSVEGAARAMFVHANTVRYRLKRVSEVTGLNPFGARDAYVLRVAVSLGRLIHQPD